MHGIADNNSYQDWLYFDSTTRQPCKYKKYWHNCICVNYILSYLATLVAYSSSMVNGRISHVHCLTVLHCLAATNQFTGIVHLSYHDNGSSVNITMYKQWNASHAVAACSVCLRSENSNVSTCLYMCIWR